MAKRLYTESDVRAMARGSELVLGKDALATPSALDAAFELGIRVVRGAAKPASDAAAAAQSGLWSRMHSQDGTYVVVIKNGRASVSRLTDQGPVQLGSE
jgi:hypothetical protein